MTSDPGRFDPTNRFSERVEDYVRYRPSYPPEVLDVLRADLGLRPEHVVADLGSGTGILSELFLRAGHVVHGVEPNAAMAEAALRLLAGTVRFHGVAGRAEATSLADGSVDLVAAGQSFHWFEPVAARAECLRILRPQGAVALVWNLRNLDRTPFLREYEALLRRWCKDYQEILSRYAHEPSLRAFFGEGGFRERHFENRQAFDFEGLRGRLLSSSYTPREGDPSHEPLVEGLRDVFELHQRNGEVEFEYDTELYYGRLE